MSQQAGGGDGENSSIEPADLRSRSVGEALSGMVRVCLAPFRWILRQKVGDVALVLGMVAALLAIGAHVATYLGREHPTTAQVESAITPSVLDAASSGGVASTPLDSSGSQR